MKEPLVLQQDSRKPRVGVVAMVDALAFKGIWKRHAFEHILERLEHIKDAAGQEREHLQKNFPKLAGALKYELEVRFLSDTIVIAARSHPLVWGPGRAMALDNMTDEDWQKVSEQGESQRLANEFIALKAVAGILANVQGAALAGAKGRPELPLLNYRGAVAYGEYLVHDNFLIGQAVDDCASMYEESDGAFVVFHESAADFWEQCQRARETIESVIVRTGQITQQDIKSYMHLCEILTYRVPMKSEPNGCLPTLGTGGEKDKSRYVINPLARFPKHEWADMAEHILRQMDPRGNAAVERKRKHTAEFLTFVNEHAPTCFPPAPPSFDEAVRILEGERA